MSSAVPVPGSGAAAGDDERLLIDFEDASPGAWTTVNDGVMGGRSQGGLRIQDGVLVFTGTTNTDGGGFSSIRAETGALDLRGYDGIRLRVRADGRRYTVRLTTSANRGSDQPAYWADFETTTRADGEVIDVPFKRFWPQWRGRRLEGPKLDVGKIDGLGLMIYDERDGPFRLEVDCIGIRIRSGAPETKTAGTNPGRLVGRVGWKRYQRSRRPPPPPPPPPLPPRDSRGLAMFTLRLRPPRSWPSMPFKAACASASLLISTKAKPRGLPVSRSVMRLTLVTVP